MSSKFSDKPPAKAVSKLFTSFLTLFEFSVFIFSFILKPTCGPISKDKVLPKWILARIGMFK